LEVLVGGINVPIKNVVAIPVNFLARAVFHYPKVVSAFMRRVSGKTSFVTSSIEGSRRFENGKFAIFLIWQPYRLPWYVQNALDAFAEAEINVVVVANHALDEAAKVLLSSQSRWVLTRDNTGYDFGGFQDATHFVREHFEVERLIYLNDSIYLFREGSTEMMQRLSVSTADICTAFENWEISYHIQSFCFSVSRRILDAPATIRFWRKYLPVNSRRWAIQQGEIELSKAMVPASRDIEVIYSPNDLHDYFSDLPLQNLISMGKELPIAIRMGRSDTNDAHDVEIQGEILRRVALRSQIHTAGFLYRRFLRCPVLKRDLVYRLQYSIYEVDASLKAIGHEGHLTEILSDMRRKGVGNQLPFLKRIQFNNGII
jgi:hypothetical protein